MAQRSIQASFTFGELDPRLFARADFSGFYKGAAKARNVVAVPQGALTKRFGTFIRAKIRDTTADADITDLDEVRVFAFERARAGIYFIVLRKDDTTDTALDVYDSDFTLQATVDGSSTWTVAQLPDINFVPTQDRMLILHPDVQPYQLLNEDYTDATDWALSAVTFFGKPTYDFSFIDGINYASSGTNFGFSSVAVNSANTITYSSTGLFNTNFVGGLLIGGGGIARIDSNSDAIGKIVVGYNLEAFSGTQLRGDQVLVREPAWNDANATALAGPARGWPSVGSVVQNRLVLANTGVLTNVAWASASNYYVQFLDYQTDADDPFSIGIDANDSIVAIAEKNTIVILGERGVYSGAQGSGEPLSISNAYVNKEDNRGAKSVPPVVFDDTLFYIDRQGYQINGMQNDVTGLGSTNFQVYNASIASSHIVGDPVSLGRYKSTTDKGRYLIASNSDGTLLIHTSEKLQEVSAWTLGETRGSFEEIADVDNITTCLVRREVNTGATIAGNADYVYKVDSTFEVFTDITSSASSASTDATLFENEDDYLLIGNQAPFDAIAVALNTAASATIVPTFEYLNNEGTWTSFTVTDGTTGFTGAGNITWVAETTTSDWTPATVNNVRNVFWIRIRRTVASLTTSPIEDTLSINTQDVIFLEQLSFMATMDATITATSDANGLVTGLDNLIGQSVFVNADGTVEGPYVVDDSGEITITEVSASDVDVGIFFAPRIVPMPVAVLDPTNPNGADLYKPRLIKQFFVDYYESLGIFIQGIPTPDIDLAGFVVGQNISPQTRVQEISPRTGWEPRVEIEITQKAPLPFTVRGIGYVVEVS